MGLAASLSHRRREAAGVGTGLAVGEAWGLDGSVEFRWAIVGVKGTLRVFGNYRGGKIELFRCMKID